MTPGILVLSKGISQAHSLLLKLRRIKVPVLTVFLMAFHTFALALPDVKSTNVTIYDKGQIYIEKSGKKD
jgi:hypothetical protein